MGGWANAVCYNTFRDTYLYSGIGQRGRRLATVLRSGRNAECFGGRVAIQTPVQRRGASPGSPQNAVQFTPATGPRRRRRGRWPRGVSVTALAAAAAAGPCPPRLPARTAVREQGEPRLGAAAVAGQTPPGQRCGGARSRAGAKRSTASFKCGWEVLLCAAASRALAAISCSAPLLRTWSPVFVLKALAAFSLRTKETSRPKTFPKLVRILSTCLSKPPGYLRGFRTNR